MIKQVGPTPIQPRHKASCHCGAVELELGLPNGIENPRRCDCSICRRKGAIAASVPLAGIRIVKGQEVLRLYGFNVGCLEGVDPFDLGEVPTNDGVNHPADRKGA